MMPVINGAMLAVNGLLAASIVAKATLVIALALSGVWLARKSRASVRHTILAATFGVLLVLPIASVVTPPVRIAVTNQTAPVPFETTTDAISPRAPTGAAADATHAIPQSSGFSLSGLLFTGWIAGMTLLLLPMLRGLWQVGLLRRTGLPWRQGQSVVEQLAAEIGVHRRVEVLLQESLSGPMTCGVLRPAIVLPPDARIWDAQDLNRAIVHELEHVRRGDWMWHCLARVVCSVYWFHPLVWISWRQLGLEAERACDDAVLGRSEATAYADQLVGLAQRLSKSPALAMANRADLSTRVRAVLDSRQPRGRAGTILVALACIVAGLVVITISPLTMAAAPQSDSAQSTGEILPKFDAVSVKLIDPSSQGTHWHEHSDAKYLNITGSIHGFILRTYGIRDAQLIGEPDWFNTRLYQIEAAAAAPVTEKQMLLMLRGVLADRFQLRLRQETRDLPVFSLEVAAGGPKFRELKPGETPVRHPEPPNGILARSFNSIGDLMNQINGAFGGPPYTDRPVLDRTHLTANYDIHLETERRSQTDAEGDSVPFPNFSRDMQTQLGLKLVAERGSMPCFVVDHAEAPAPN